MCYILIINGIKYWLINCWLSDRPIDPENKLCYNWLQKSIIKVYDLQEELYQMSIRYNTSSGLSWKGYLDVVVKTQKL